ncbi:MAG: hypothetical protein FJX31_03660, partial [Alphaproteobacteria bacterium]|nr:hypothetical protein [Alphaproteobacteria bacterium]
MPVAHRSHAGSMRPATMTATAAGTAPCPVSSGLPRSPDHWTGSPGSRILRARETRMALKEAVGRVHIHMPREQVWEKLRDLSLAHNYVPGVTAVRIDTTQREGVGTSRTVTIKNGSQLQETVEEWTDGHGFLIRLHKG